MCTYKSISIYMLHAHAYKIFIHTYIYLKKIVFLSFSQEHAQNIQLYCKRSNFYPLSNLSKDASAL